jgi:hypothetical protein
LPSYTFLWFFLFLTKEIYWKSDFVTMTLD